MPDDAVCATQLLLERPLINGVLVCFLYAAATIPWRKLTVLHDPRFLKQMPAGCVQDVIAQVTRRGADSRSDGGQSCVQQPAVYMSWCCSGICPPLTAPVAIGAAGSGHIASGAGHT